VRGGTTFFRVTGRVDELVAPEPSVPLMLAVCISISLLARVGVSVPARRPLSGR
jgi:hypothetical protein